jgi:hypothetical protein
MTGMFMSDAVACFAAEAAGGHLGHIRLVIDNRDADAHMAIISD